MAVEIERKFLLKNSDWRQHAASGARFIQGYLTDTPHASVRVRIEGKQAFLNIKSATIAIRRLEFEYPIPIADARGLLTDLCRKPLIEKTRYGVVYQGHAWEIDVFEGENDGLIVAEIELQDEDEPFHRPPWLGDEVSDDPRYYNVNLVTHPYRLWR